MSGGNGSWKGGCIARDAGARVERVRHARLSRVATHGNAVRTGVRVERWRREARRLECRCRRSRRLDARDALGTLAGSIRGTHVHAAASRHELEDLANDEIDATTVAVLLELVGEHLKVLGRNVDLVAQVAEELALHLVDLPKAEETLTDDSPALVGVGVVATALAGDHEGRDEETVARRSACCREADLESQQEVQGLEGDGLRQAGPVQRISDELGQARSRSTILCRQGCRSRGRVERAGKEVEDESLAKFRSFCGRAGKVWMCHKVSPKGLQDVVWML